MNDRWRNKINSYFAKKKSAIIAAYAEYRNELTKCEQKFLERLPDSDPGMTRERVEAIVGSTDPEINAAWLDAIREVHGYEPNPLQVMKLINADQLIENPADGDQIEIYAEAEKFGDGPLPDVLNQRNICSKYKVFVETEFAPPNSDDEGNFDVHQEADAVRRLHKVTKTERETSYHEASSQETTTASARPRCITMRKMSRRWPRRSEACDSTSSRSATSYRRSWLSSTWTK